VAGPNSGHLPLLLFPQPTSAERQKGPQNPPDIHVPGHARQAQRVDPQFQALQTALDARRLELQATMQNNDPDLVIVFETIGAIDDFIPSAERISGLSWLAAALAAEIEPDDDFYSTKDADKKLSGKLFLMGSNREALTELVRLWELYKANRKGDLGSGLSAWKGLFANLKDVRFWGPQDRLGDELRDAWRFRLEHGDELLKFEIEAWCFKSTEKNESASREIRTLVGALGGRMLDERLIPDIAYAGFLVEMPAEGVRQLLDEAPPDLLRSERVMVFRPQGQAIELPAEEGARVADAAVPDQRTSGNPIVAVLDGLPMANHPRLQGRLVIDDPDGWAAAYPAGQRAHGTAIASLIAWGDLDSGSSALAAPIYVRPIMRPDFTRNPPQESTPTDRLLVDLVHEAVRRMFEGGPEAPAAAPTVRVINLSIGDRYRPFAGELSPWARLIDWLSHKYRVLFIVSSGNCSDDLVLNIARETLQTLAADIHNSASMNALMSRDIHRSLLAPAESVNALTVGACYSDGSRYTPVPGRFPLFAERGIAPYSCIGPGFRRSIKPDILLPGGRALYRESPVSPREESHMSGVWETPQPPGHRVAAPPGAGGDTVYSRGTSYAAALATRWAAQTFDVLEALRAGAPAALPARYDAVVIKALLAHGATWGDIKAQVLSARPEVEDYTARCRLVSRYAGYGVADVERALTCTEQRATMLGVGHLKNEKACEFRVPLPECLNATLVRRRLTITLAWLTPPNSRHSKYRAARMWVDVPLEPLRLRRLEGDWRQLKLGTLHHETFEGEGAVPIVAGQHLMVRVNCVADAGALIAPVDFALCVSLEIAEGVDLPIYAQLRAQIATPVAVSPNTSQ